MRKAHKASGRINTMFRAFSDRTRLRILSLLQQGECCVGDLVSALRIEQPSASRHLAYLRRAGLVVVRKAGLWSFYSLAPADLPFHRKLLECLACCFEDVPQLRQDRARAQRLKSEGGCCPGEKASEPVKPEQPGKCCDG